MKKFKFSLQALLKVKILSRDEVKRSLMVLQNRALALHEDLKKLHYQIDKYTHYVPDKKNIDIMYLYQLNIHTIFLKEEEVKLKEKIEKSNKRIKKEQKRLSEKEQEVKYIEKIKEKRLALFIKEQNKIQDKKMQDFYILSWKKEVD